MPYYLILALQGFCIYHSIKNRNSYYWIFLILFIPLIGSIIYIVTQVFSKKDVDKIQSEITTIINPTKKIKDLEKALQFSETFQNKVNLADAYYEAGGFNEAIKYYQSSLVGNFENDFYVLKQLVLSYFKINDFDNAVICSKRIKENQQFTSSEAQFIYGLSLEKLGRLDEAETELRKVDKRYCNYEERFALAKFLNERGKQEDAREILNEIHTESQHINKDNKRRYKAIFREVEEYMKSL